MMEISLTILLISCSLLIIVSILYLIKEFICYMINSIFSIITENKYIRLKNNYEDVKRRVYDFNKIEQSRYNASVAPKSDEERKAGEYADNLGKKKYNEIYGQKYDIPKEK